VDIELGIYDITDHCDENDTPIVWTIRDLPCGSYNVYAEGYVNGDPCPVAFGELDKTLDLDYVNQDDFVHVAPIYKGDRYITPGHKNPHDPNVGSPTVDCSGYVTQVLRRLARLQVKEDPEDPPTYPILHMGAACWGWWGWGSDYYCNQYVGGHRLHQPRSRTQNVPLENLAKGDIISWRGTDKHVVIFHHWHPRANPSQGDLRAYVWESRGYDGVGKHLRELYVAQNPHRFRDKDGNLHIWWMVAETHVLGEVFNPCP
jgi:hypothetical protein